MGKRREERIIHNAIGDEIHIFGNDELRVKKLDPTIWLPSDDQWCPRCHTRLPHFVVDGEGYYECDCGWTITDEEVENGDGYPSEESTYEDDYGDYYGGNDWEEDEEYDEDDEDEE